VEADALAEPEGVDEPVVGDFVALGEGGAEALLAINGEQAFHDAGEDIKRLSVEIGDVRCQGIDPADDAGDEAAATPWLAPR